MTQIISVRIDDDLYMNIKDMNINITDVVKAALQRKVKDVEKERMKHAVRDVTRRLKEEGIHLETGKDSPGR
jgi:Post-segregation antitoxin CcdA.